ncbi:MAG: NAD-dependent epimerase/dehydratase family protein, partial [Pedobacter sp.]
MPSGQPTPHACRYCDTFGRADHPLSPRPSYLAPVYSLFLLFIVRRLRLATLYALRQLDMDPVLVLGGCGALGHHIIQQLLDTKKALDVTSLDIRTDVNRVPGAKYIKGCITSEKDVRSVLEMIKPKVVMHTVSPQLMGQKNTHELYESV